MNAKSRLYIIWIYTSCHFLSQMDLHKIYMYKGLIQDCIFFNYMALLNKSIYNDFLQVYLFFNYIALDKISHSSITCIHNIVTYQIVRQDYPFIVFMWYGYMVANTYSIIHLIGIDEIICFPMLRNSIRSILCQLYSFDSSHST